MTDKEKRTYLILCGWEMDFDQYPYVKETWNKSGEPYMRVSLTAAYNFETTGYVGTEWIIYEIIKWGWRWILMKTKLKST